MQASPDYRKCEEKAEEVLKRYKIDSPWVNVFSIAKKEGINIEYRNFSGSERFKDVSGFLLATKEPRTIYLNIDDQPNRRTFTVAHELGHYFLGHDPDEYGMYMRNGWQGSGGKPDIEREADCFAANLLMPKQMFEDIKLPRKTIGRIPQVLAQLFGVSTEAMRHRLKTLKYR